MKITYDPAKRLKTIREREIDFDFVHLVFSGQCYHFEDTRFDYGEKRMICFGYLEARAVIVVYVKRGDATHIISMRKANDREQKQFSHKTRPSQN